MQLGRLEVLSRLIAAGWGDHPGNKIPAAVKLAAENGRAAVPQADKPRQPPVRTAAANLSRRAAIAKRLKNLPPRICTVCAREYTPSTIGITETCGVACRLVRKREVKRALYQSRSQRAHAPATTDWCANGYAAAAESVKRANTVRTA